MFFFGKVFSIAPFTFFMYIVSPVFGSRCGVSLIMVILVGGSDWVTLVALILVNLSMFQSCAVIT